MRRALVPLFGVLLLWSSACSKGGDSGVDDEDDSPPSLITDLTVVQATSASVTLRWTAPSGGGDFVAAASYDLRYASSSIDQSNWNAALEIEDEPTPGIGGLPQGMVLTGVPADTVIYFAIRSCSQAGNWSGVSNSPEAVVPPEAAVAFADPALESVVRAIIKVPDGDIMPEDLLDVTEIDAPQRNIRDLEGIQYCVSLRRLSLRSNAVAQLGPLAGLVQLSDLDLSSNGLSDIGPLSALASMMNLNLSDNAITEIDALQRMEVLNFLWLDRNRITDLGPVAGCWRLNHLFVSDNQVVDLAPLGSMEFVGDLDLSGNLIVDVAPLVANDAFATGDHIWLARNPLSATAVDEQIPALRARGVVVHTE